MKGTESHTGKGYGDSKVEHTRFDGECRNCGTHGHKAADCWYKQQHKPQGKGKGTGKSKSNVTEISEIDASKQAEETCSLNTSLQPSSLSQVNSMIMTMTHSDNQEVKPCPTDANGEVVTSAKRISLFCGIPREVHRLCDQCL